MEEIKLSPWLEYADSNSKEIYRVSNQLGNIVNKLNKHGIDQLIAVDCGKLMNNIAEVVSHWTQNTYVGYRKRENLKKAYQSFYENLYKFLQFFRYTNCGFYSDLAKESLYQGILYRYLGHGSEIDNIHEKINPEFNNIYVSWSKNKTSTYLEGKLNGTITKVTCIVKGNYWGIDLKPLGIVCMGEDEVVFPTIKETISNITFIER